MALHETIREAIRSKAETDVTALRGATPGRRRNPLHGSPRLYVGIPRFVMDVRPQGHLEIYTLTYPGYLNVSAAPGEQRADAEVSDLLRALIVAWRSGTQLGLGGSGVVGSWISAADPAYGGEDGDTLLGYDLVWTVAMHETLSTGRTT